MFKALNHGAQWAMPLEQKRRGYADKHQHAGTMPLADDANVPEYIVDRMPTEESEVIVDDDSVGKCSSMSPSNLSNEFDSNLGLGDDGNDEDDSSLAEGVRLMLLGNADSSLTTFFGTIVRTPLPRKQLFCLMPHLHHVNAIAGGVSRTRSAENIV